MHLRAIRLSIGKNLLSGGLELFQHDTIRTSSLTIITGSKNLLIPCTRRCICCVECHHSQRSVFSVLMDLNILFSPLEQSGCSLIFPMYIYIC